jgi:hypothetical protein
MTEALTGGLTVSSPRLSPGAQLRRLSVPAREGLHQRNLSDGDRGGARIVSGEPLVS